MSQDDPYYDKYKAIMSSDQRLVRDKFAQHAPPRRLDQTPVRPSDEELHALARQMIEAQPQGNPDPRRKDTLQLVVVPKTERGNNGPS